MRCLRRTIAQSPDNWQWLGEAGQHRRRSKEAAVTTREEEATTPEPWQPICALQKQLGEARRQQQQIRRDSTDSSGMGSDDTYAEA